MLFSSSYSLRKLSLVSAILLLSFSTVGCRVQQTQDAELPDVDVEVEADPGQLPAYDVDGPEVEVGTTEETIKVPEVEVSAEEKTIEVPTIDIDLPGGEDAEAAEESAE